MSVARSKPQREIRPQEPEAVAPAPVHAGSPAAVLALQRHAGNHAVARHLGAQRELARAPAVDADERADADKARPDWYRLDSEQDALPGDPVPGITDAERALTEADRKALMGTLDTRLDANSTRVKRFVLDFDRATRHVWTSYIAHEMEDALEDAHWPTWAKLLSFTVREALVALFHSSIVAMGAAHMVAAGLEKTAEYAGEQAHEKIHEAGQTSKQHAKKTQLMEQATAFSDAIRPNLEAALAPLAEGQFYSRWLRDAPLSELHKFRNPPLCPASDLARTQFLIAENMTAFAFERRHATPRAGQQNLLDIRLTMDKVGRCATKVQWFAGADAFREAFAGVPVSQLPDVPVHVELTGGLEPEDISIEGMAIWGKSPIELVFDAYEKGEKTRIYRGVGDRQFVVVRGEGALGTHLALARLGNPSLDVVALVKGVMAGAEGPTSQAEPKPDVVATLRAMLEPLIQVGGDALVDDEIMPRVVVPVGGRPQGS